jgi:hypothetical protein
MSKRGGEIGKLITLKVKFFENGVLFNPYNIVSVSIKTARNGGSTLATLTPTNISTGIYSISWTIPADTSLGLLYDHWNWQAQSDMDVQTRIYSFRVSAYSDCITSSPKEIRGPLFVGTPEVDFFNSITKELIQKVVAQKVIYYSISEKNSKSHPIYNESIKKTSFIPVEINCLALYEEPTQTNTRFSIDTIYSLKLYFHYHELLERNIIPREGDFVKYGKIIYEIQKLVQPQITFGQINNKVMVEATCRVARESQFKVFDEIKGFNES